MMLIALIALGMWVNHLHLRKSWTAYFGRLVQWRLSKHGGLGDSLMTISSNWKVGLAYRLDVDGIQPILGTRLVLALARFIIGHFRHAAIWMWDHNLLSNVGDGQSGRATRLVITLILSLVDRLHRSIHYWLII